MTQFTIVPDIDEERTSYAQELANEANEIFVVTALGSVMPKTGNEAVIDKHGGILTECHPQGRN